ncbi:MAG: hypothetical protein GF398_07785 [Chitinivibrionales bacterium]|nr:hypothetical protein [Chitinivibrionales bacterium]
MSSGVSVGGVSAGKARVTASLTLTIVDGNGDELVSETSTAFSDEGTGMVAGVTSDDKIDAMCTQAFGEALEEVYDSLKKKTAKAQEKS